MDGPGFRIIAGVGLPFIMVTGFMMTFMGGCGFPGMNGLRPGSPGGNMATTMDGLPSRRGYKSVWHGILTGHRYIAGLLFPGIIWVARV